MTMGIVLAADEATRWGPGRVDVLLAALLYLPMLGLWAWHRLSERGSDATSLGIFPVLVAAGAAFAVIEGTAGVGQLLAFAALAGLLLVVLWMHRRVELPPARSSRRVRWRGWRRWWRLAAVAFLVLGVIELGFGEVEAQGTECGSLPDALGSGNRDCEGEAGMYVFGAMACASGAAALVVSLARGRRVPLEPQTAPGRPPRRVPLRAAGRDP